MNLKKILSEIDFFCCIQTEKCKCHWLLGRNMNNHVSIAVIYCVLVTLSLTEIGQDGSKENKSKDKAFAKGSARH